jgi:translation initiation factor 2 subunit 3
LIAANEGIKPQTKEHLIALQAKKVDKILIVQNKIDLVTKEQALKNYEDIKKFVKGTIAESAEIIPVSAQQEINVDKIKDWILNLEIPKRDVDSPAEFLIARSFDINKPGTKINDLHGGVLAGVLKRGVLKVGDEIEIKPGVEETHANQTAFKPVRTKIVSIYRGNYPINEAGPGGSLAFETEFDNVLTKTDSLSGSIASEVGSLPEISTSLRLKYSLFKELVGEEKISKIEDLVMSEMIMLSINTSITVGQIKKLSGDGVEFALKIPIVPIKGDSVGLARNIHGHWRLVGFGEII